MSGQALAADLAKAGLRNLSFKEKLAYLAGATLLLLYPLTEPKLKDMLNDMYERDANELGTGSLPEDATLDGLASDTAPSRKDNRS